MEDDKKDEGHKVLYHGSHKRHLDVLEPRPSNVLDGEEAVFATNVWEIALIFSRKWTDDDLELGVMNDHLYVAEMFPGAFSVLCGDGMIYHIKKMDEIKKFTGDERLGMKDHEFISKTKVEYSFREYCPNIKKVLDDSENIICIKYEEREKTFAFLNSD